MFPALFLSFRPLLSPAAITRKQSKSIMDEAFPLLFSAVPCCQSVGRPWSERPYKQPLFHYSYRCFKEGVALALFTPCPCKQPWLLPRHSHFLPFVTVVCWSASFLLHTASFFNPPSPHYHFLYSIQGLEGIPAAKVVFSRQCSTGIWLSLLGRGRLGLRDLAAASGWDKFHD